MYMYDGCKKMEVDSKISLEMPYSIPSNQYFVVRLSTHQNFYDLYTSPLKIKMATHESEVIPKLGRGKFESPDKPVYKIS